MVVLDRRNQPRQGRPGLQAHPAHEAHGSPHQASGPPVHSVFSVLILLSTGLLTLPISTTNHDGFSNFPVSFFTAVSALSTCGIPVVNTGEYWSMFGQVGHPVFHPVRWTWRDDLCFDSRIGWLFRRRGQRRQPSMPVHSCGRNDCRSRLP